MSSRWANDNDEDAEYNEKRKKQKEEKRRLREEKQLASNIKSTRIATDPGENGLDSTRPSKRQRTASPSQKDGSRNIDSTTPLTRTFQPSRTVDQYDILNNIEEGSYGFVSRARMKMSGEVVALKRLKMDRNVEGFPVTGLREIQTLQACSHPHIVNLREIVLGVSSTQE